jgi:3-phenylpropionate/cinnamic acid dioxygenase small subunit
MSPQEFIALEARLIDEQRFDDWLALFAEDGRYWVPLQGAAQEEGAPHNALADEDRLLLSPARAAPEEPEGALAASAQPLPARAAGSTLVSEDAHGCELRTPFLYIESRGERQVLLAGACTHRLVRAGDGWRIRLKRVDLHDAGAPLPAIQLFP